MNQLLNEFGGWFGYLQRQAVLWQLVGTVAIVMGVHLAALPHRRRRPISPVVRDLIKLGLMLVWAALLRLLGQAQGLVLFFAGLQAIWIGLEVLRLLLVRRIDPRTVGNLYTQLLKPGFFIGATMALVQKLDSISDLAGIPLGTYFGSPINLGQLFTAVATLYLLITASGLPSIWLAWLLQRSIGITQSSRRAMELMIRYLLVGIGILLVVDQLGIKGNGLLAVAGGLSVGLGFGIKEVFSNFVSGLWLLVEGSVRPGEVLIIDSDPCEVRSLGLRAAVLWRQRDNAELVIPNQTFFTTTTTTYTGSDTLRRSQVLVSAAYRHDPAEVQDLLVRIASSCAGVLSAPPPAAFFLSYGDSSINYTVRFWIANPMNNLSICNEVAKAIWHTFQEQGIEIPFPQMVLHDDRSGAQTAAYPNLNAQL
jgi:small-conductance mechanosensitive channel